MYNNEHAIQLINNFLHCGIPARKFERSNGLSCSFIDKAKKAFIKAGVNAELVERLNNK